MSETSVIPEDAQEAAQTFSFKPNALLPSQTFQVTASDIVWDRKWRKPRRLSFEDIRRIRFWNISQSNVESFGLALESRSGGTIHLQFVDTGLRGEGPHGIAFHKAGNAIISALKTHRPDLDVTVSNGLAARFTLFLTGAILAMFFVLVSLFALYNGYIFEGVYALFPTTIGAVMAWNFRPWQPPQRIRLEDLADELLMV